MSARQRNQLGRQLSRVLRHAPESIGIELDHHGWTSVDALIRALGRKGIQSDRVAIDQIVCSNEKNRFEISEDGERIRARQGHSVEIALNYEPVTPPSYLYHGTAMHFLPSILETGLDKRGRHHVHMSVDMDMMHKVGARHGEPVVLRIQSGAMHKAGYVFYVTGNHVWLTDHVPVKYLSALE